MTIMDLKLLLCLASMALMVGFTTAVGGSCPLPSKVQGCSPKCYENYECTNGRLCCPNNCNTKSCADVAPYSSGSGSGSDKYSKTGGAGTYCNNVKCSSFEVCKLDPSSNRMKCMRA